MATPRWETGALRRALVVFAIVATALVVPAHALALEDYDARTGVAEPSAAQRSEVAALGAQAEWNDFGTPSTLVVPSGWLATGVTGADAVSAALNYLNANKSLFGITTTDNLVVHQDSKLAGSSGHAVTFRQKFGDLLAAEGGMVTIGLVKAVTGTWKIASASSTLARDTSLAGAPQLSAAAGWAAAATNAGFELSVTQTRVKGTEGGWTLLVAAGFTGPQRVRLVAVPTPDRGVIPAWEALVVRNVAGDATAYHTFVDARDGSIIVRKNIVEQLHQPAPTPFAGTMAPGGCGADHTFVAPANTRSIEVEAQANVLAVDIVLLLVYNPGPGETVVASADTGTSPEAIHYTGVGGNVPAGTYAVRVCEYSDPIVHCSGATCSYSGTYFVNDVLPTEPFPYPPKWKLFPSYPLLNTLEQDPWNNPSTDIREVWCWDASVNGVTVPGCDRDIGNLACPPGQQCSDQLGNLASRAPWDADPVTAFQTSTFTTRGNNAHSAEAWTSPLTPGATNYKPVSLSRDYSFPWTNQWFTSDCNEASLLSPQRNDIDAAIVNLFAMHNRMHDWSYMLGFTEENWNAQDNNFGLTAPNRGNDNLLGDAQAGALNGGFPSYLGRDNANMIPLPDGVHPITNMYLWQPLAGAFYAPCVDGDYDMAVIGHEYAHLIENRMIGKGSSRSGHHAGAMGESHADLNGMEILNEYSFGGKNPTTGAYLAFPHSGENPYSVGAYVTGNKDRAIRNYGMNFPRTGRFPEPGLSLVHRCPVNRPSPTTTTAQCVDPLNFSDIGYDITGAQVHADGEIWSTTNFDIREALVTKYNASFPASDKTLQRRCADGKLPADRCPGNRRWAQIMYDAYLLMSAAPSMLDARNAYLAADQLRNGDPTITWPSNQNELWLAFARRGFGEKAFSTNTTGEPTTSPTGNDLDPKPNFESPRHNEITVTFTASTPDTGTALPPRARIFVGHYEARVSPIADTDPSTNVPACDSSGKPAGCGGENTLDAVARFVPGVYEFVAVARGYGHLRFRLELAENEGTSQTVNLSMPANWASTAQGGAAFGDGAQHSDLIDDTESTNWDYHVEGSDVSVVRPQVTVDLGGGAKTVDRVKVSAMLFRQNRFTALRQFEVRTCTASTANANCTNPAVGFTTIYTSPANAFPGFVPRPVAPEMILREFDVANTTATHVQIRVLHNQCTGNTQFQGEQDADPLNDTDCRVGTPAATAEIFGEELPQVLEDRDDEVHIAELQVFGSGGGAGPPPPPPSQDPAVVLTKTGPATATAGSTITYTLEYRNLGPAASSNARIVDTLPSNVRFVSASNGGTYSAFTRKVTWRLGTVPAGATGTVTLRVQINSNVASGTVITNRADFTGDLTVSPPTATATTVVQ